MGTQIIGLGTITGDGLGDGLKTGGGKVNSNVFNYVATAISYTALVSDYVIECTDTLTITLPTAVGNNSKRYVIKNTGASKTITIDGDGSETIDGAANKVITVDYDSVEVFSNNVQWLII